MQELFRLFLNSLNNPVSTENLQRWTGRVDHTGDTGAKYFRRTFYKTCIMWIQHRLLYSILVQIPESVGVFIPKYRTSVDGILYNVVLKAQHKSSTIDQKRGHVWFAWSIRSVETLLQLGSISFGDVKEFVVCFKKNFDCFENSRACQRTHGHCCR